MISKKQLNCRERESLAYIFAFGLLVCISTYISAASDAYTNGLEEWCTSTEYANEHRDECMEPVHPQAAEIKKGKRVLGKNQKISIDTSHSRE